LGSLFSPTYWDIEGANHSPSQCTAAAAAARNSNKDRKFHLEGHVLAGPVRQLHAARPLLLDLIFSWQQEQED
jgi:hypothetical protein